MAKSIMQTDCSRCYLTGSPYNLEEHHVMNGPFRKKAEKYGLKVKLSHSVHRWLHDTGDGRKFMYYLKAQAQYIFVNEYSYDKWMQEFKKDYSMYYVSDIQKLYRKWIFE